MAGAKSFMTSLLALLDDDKFVKDDSRMPCSTAEQVIVENYLSLIKKILDFEGDQGQKTSTSILAETHDPFSSTINELCCQISCEAQHTDRASQTMASLLHKLSSFSWDVKAVLTLSAFSVYYAENRHLAESEKSDYKLRLAAVLRGPRAGKLPSGALKDLIRVTLEFTECTVEFASYLKKPGALSTSTNIAAIFYQIRASFYQIICSVIGCSVPFTCMIRASNEFLEQDLSPFLSRAAKIYESFKKQVEDFKRKSEEHLLYKEIRDLYRLRTDTVKFMALLFGEVNRGSEMTRAKVEELQNKNVMLLISDRYFSNVDMITLNSIYKEKRFQASNYEIVWVPVAGDDKDFQRKRSQMPWYSCNFVVSNAAAKFIQKRWQFKQRTKVVVLNEKWDVENPDAMPMIRLWGSEALPFTRKRSDELWEKHSSTWLKLVVNATIFQHIEPSFERNELIFLYGSAEGSDTLKQIDNILSSKTYATFNIKFFNINTIGDRKQFLSRLENCICSKMPANKETPDSGALKLIELHNSYKKKSGLAILARGPDVIVNTSLPDLWKVLSEHESWIDKTTSTEKFDAHFLAYYRKVIVTPRCYEFSIPNMVDVIPEWVPCPTLNCHQNMENFVTFKCCHGEH